ncbi:hypothetical protein SMICM17S_13260 [Streptomyces microflavus]
MSAVTAGGTAGLLVGGEPGEGEAQVAVAGVAEEAGGADDGRLAGAGELGEAGDGEGGMRARVRSATASATRCMERVMEGASVRTFAARAAGAGGESPLKISFTSWVTSERSEPGGP